MEYSSLCYIVGSCWLSISYIVDCDCSHEIKICLLLGRKVMTKLDSILKAETLLCQQRSIKSKLLFFQQGVRVGLSRKLRAEELMFLNSGVGEDF